MDLIIQASLKYLHLTQPCSRILNPLKSPTPTPWICFPVFRRKSRARNVIFSISLNIYLLKRWSFPVIPSFLSLQDPNGIIPTCSKIVYHCINFNNKNLVVSINSQISKAPTNVLVNVTASYKVWTVLLDIRIVFLKNVINIILQTPCQSLITKINTIEICSLVLIWGICRS